jgi:hypothetical protein
MSTTTIMNVSTIPPGMTSLPQVTTAPPQGEGTPSGQPTGRGLPPRPPGGGGGPPTGGLPGGTALAPAVATVPNLPGIQNGMLKGAVPTTFNSDHAKTNQFI